MGIFDITSDSENNLPSEFKDPFKKDTVDRVVVEFHKTKSNWFRDGKRHVASIYFSNGNTKGEQAFYDDDPKELMRRVESFIDQL